MVATSRIFRCHERARWHTLVPLFAAWAAVDENAEALWDLSLVPDNPSWPDENSVELGVRFITTEDTAITGVRFYKGDLITGIHFGTLWTESGDLLATGEFTDESAEGWQDLMFGESVAIVPGQTYIASYWAPAGYYAATNDYFSDQEVTVGPITALRAVGAEGNRVYSYSETSTYPEFSFWNTNYWVTPLWSSDVPPGGDGVPPPDDDEGDDDDDESDDDQGDDNDNGDNDRRRRFWRRWFGGRG